MNKNLLLLRQSHDLREFAKNAERMADELEKMPDPIGPAITSMAAMLLRHGLCVIDRDALIHAEFCMQAFEADGLCEQTVHEQAIEAVQAAIKGLQ